MNARKGNARWQAGADTTEQYAENDTRLHNPQQRAHDLIGTLAIWGVLPIGVADWLIRRFVPGEKWKA